MIIIVIQLIVVLIVIIVVLRSARCCFIRLGINQTGGWRAASAAGMHGQGSRKGSVIIISIITIIIINIIIIK